MRDIQNEQDTRKTPLQKVGVKGVRYPVTVLDKNRKLQQTTAEVDLFVNLPHNFKGTHMSRFIETFHKYHEDLTMNRFLEMLEEIREKLNAERSFGCIRFPYFIEKKAPVSGSPGIMEYTCSYEAEVGVSKDADGEPSIDRKFYVTIEVPVTTLCPCSKAISERGAHNQRGTVKVKLLYSGFFWIEDIISMIEGCASSPLYSVLKRQDEKYVTEQAYDNPRFVEDVVREVYQGLLNYGKTGAANAESAENKHHFTYFSVEAENFESIHYHNAYAYTEYSEDN